jgi:hypothetical protein
MAGAVSSSYCPFLTFQIKASKKSPAIDILAISNKIITLIPVNCENKTKSRARSEL